MNKIKEKFKKKDKKIISTIYHVVLFFKFEIIRLLSLFFFIFPINNKKIIVDSYFGKGYGDNPKYIIQFLLNNKDIKIIWLTNNFDEDMPSSIKQVKANSLKALYELATAKVWIDNCRKNFVPIKRKKQFYIQTWHGGIALKYIEKDAIKLLSRYYEHIAKRDSKNCNIMIAGSEFGKRLMENSFWYSGEVKLLGTPRSDILVEKKQINTDFREKFGFSENCMLILYAPTFRKNGSLDLTDFQVDSILNSFETRFGKRCKLLIRLHPIDSTNKIDNFDNRVVDMTNYPDMQLLLYESDIIITDYSSSMFDALIGNKICFLYANDIKDYLKNDRPMYFNIENLPFPLAQNSNELVNLVLNFDMEKYLNEASIFSRKLGIMEDGYAGRRIADLVNSIIE